MFGIQGWALLLCFYQAMAGLIQLFLNGWRLSKRTPSLHEDQNGGFDVARRKNMKCATKIC
jgi:hypothetical protein